MEWAAVIRDLVIGLLAAGAIAWVPDGFWRAFFFADLIIAPILNIVFLGLAAVLVVRFIRTGGMPMLNR